MLTIIIKVYNEEEYIQESLESIIKQITDTEEVLVIDDGSTDNSKIIIDDVIRRYPDSNIRYYYKENGGPGSVCNYGIQKSTKEYIYIVDGDDILPENTIASIRETLDEESIDYLFFNSERISFDGTTSSIRFPIKKDVLLDESIKKTLLNYSPSVCNKVFRKSIITDNNIEFPNTKIGEDLNAVTKILVQSKRIKYIDKTAYKYYQRNNSLTNSGGIKKNLDIIVSVRDLVDYFKEENLLEKYANELYLLIFKHLLVFSTVRLIKTSSVSEKKQVNEAIKLIYDHFKSISQEIKISNRSKKRIQLSNKKHYLVYFLVRINQIGILNLVINKGRRS